MMDIDSCSESKATNRNKINGAFVYGIGTEIVPLEIDARNCTILLVVSGIHLSASQVYGKYAMDGFSYSPGFTTENSVVGLEFLEKKNNDLTLPVIALFPEIDNILIEISSQEGCFFSRMTGSGSTCFGIFKDVLLAEKAVLKLKCRFSHYVIYTTGIL